MNPNVKLEHPVLSAELRSKAEGLIGTCHMSDPDWFAELVESGTKEELLELDSIVFSCEGCGWWCDADECNEDDGWFCDDCMADRKGDKS